MYGCCLQDNADSNAAEEYQIELFREQAEHDLVNLTASSGHQSATSPSNNMLAVFGPVLIKLVTHKSQFSHPSLQAHATLALSKFMCVSRDFCANNLRLLFTLLQHTLNNSSHTESEGSENRANLMIATGDLAFRFPNDLGKA